MRRHLAFLSAIAVAGWGSPSPAAILSFRDAEAFRSAVANLQEIDFDTLPDGSALSENVQITPSFNFTDQGVTFSSSVPMWQRLGPAGGELALVPEIIGEGNNRITAGLVTPVTAVGIIAPAGSTLSVYDMEQQLLGSVGSVGFGSGAFIGFVSDTPIATAVGGSHQSFLTFESFLYAPVPEPATLALLALGAAALLRRRW